MSAQIVADFRIRFTPKPGAEEESVSSTSVHFLSEKGFERLLALSPHASFHGPVRAVIDRILAGSGR